MNFYVVKTFGFLCVWLIYRFPLWDPRTVARQAPLSMVFPRQEYWVGSHFYLQGDLPDPGIEPRSPALPVHGVAKSRTQLRDFTFTFHFHALEKEMATHYSVLAWTITGMGGLPSLGSHRVRHDWSNLAAAAAAARMIYING